MIDHEHAIELVPLYALDALEGEELAEVASHVDSCEICSAELARNLAATTALVPDGPAPAHVWSRIEAELSPQADVVSIGSASSAMSNAWRWVLGAAAAVALVFAGFLVGQGVGTDPVGSEAIVAAADNASREPGTFVADFFVDDVAVAQVVVAADGSGYIIPSAELEALGSDRTYQLWVLTPDEQAISAGVLGSAPNPATFTWTADYAGFALTREVAGGVEASAGDVVSVITET